MEHSFRKAGFSVKINSPFAGALVPMRYYGSNARVQSVMIEVKRSLYCDEITGGRLPGYLDMRARLRECIVRALELNKL